MLNRGLSLAFVVVERRYQVSQKRLDSLPCPPKTLASTQRALRKAIALLDRVGVPRALAASACRGAVCNSVLVIARRLEVLGSVAG